MSSPYEFFSLLRRAYDSEIYGNQSRAYGALDMSGKFARPVGYMVVNQERPSGWAGPDLTWDDALQREVPRIQWEGRPPPNRLWPGPSWQGSLANTQGTWEGGAFDRIKPPYVELLKVAPGHRGTLLRQLLGLSVLDLGQMPHADRELSRDGSRLARNLARRYGVQPHPYNLDMRSTFDELGAFGHLDFDDLDNDMIHPDAKWRSKDELDKAMKLTARQKPWTKRMQNLQLFNPDTLGGRDAGFLKVAKPKIQPRAAALGMFAPLAAEIAANHIPNQDVASTVRAGGMGGGLGSIFGPRGALVGAGLGMVTDFLARQR